MFTHIAEEVFEREKSSSSSPLTCLPLLPVLLCATLEEIKIPTAATESREVSEAFEDVVKVEVEPTRATAASSSIRERVVSEPVVLVLLVRIG